MEENLSLGRQLFCRVWLQGGMSKVIRFLCFWILLVVKMLLIVIVLPFLVVMVVMLLCLGRLEVGHWGEALLANVVFDCPPLHLVLQDSKTRSMSWDIEWCIVPWTQLSALPLPQREGHRGPVFGSCEKFGQYFSKLQNSSQIPKISNRLTLPWKSNLAM